MSTLKVLRDHFQEHRWALKNAILLLIVYSLNQCHRFLLTIARIPFIDHNGHQYAVLIGPCFTLTYTIAGIFMGWIADRSNRVRGLAISLAAWSLVTGMIGTTNKYWQVVILRIGQGFFEAGCTPFAAGILADSFKSEHRGTAMGIYSVGIYIGYTIAMVLGGALTDAVGWRWAYVIPSAFGVVFAGFVFVFMHDPVRGGLHSDNEDAASEQPDTFSLKQIGKYWIKNPALLLLCVASAIRLSAGYIWGDYMALFYSPLYEEARGSNMAPIKCQVSHWNTTPGVLSCQDPNYPYCINQRCVRVSETPWHNIGMSRGDFLAYVSWIPLAFGSLGQVFGGMISDFAQHKFGIIGRIGVIILTTAIAAPFTYWVFVMDFPNCFFALIPRILFGEMYAGVALTLILELVPLAMRSTSIGIYLLLTTTVGGNMTVILPWVKSFFNENFTFTILADDHKFSLTVPGSVPLQKALAVLVTGGFCVTLLVFLAMAILVCLQTRKRVQMKSDTDLHRDLL